MNITMTFKCSCGAAIKVEREINPEKIYRGWQFFIPADDQSPVDHWIKNHGDHRNNESYDTGRIVFSN
jgi:hypothetical protein